MTLTDSDRDSDRMETAGYLETDDIASILHTIPMDSRSGVGDTKARRPRRACRPSRPSEITLRLSVCAAGLASQLAIEKLQGRNLENSSIRCRNPRGLQGWVSIGNVTVPQPLFKFSKV